MKHKPYIDQEYPTTNREYKDGLFRLVFQKKEDLLSLYNAVNGSNYSNPAELEVNTLGNVLYLTDILTDQKAEVIQMILETYDKELHDKTLRSEGYETGKAEGYKTGKADGISSERENGILQLLSTLQELNISRQDAHIKLKEKYSLSKEEAEKYLDKYWKGL